jgi:hypothetical protein
MDSLFWRDPLDNHIPRAFGAIVVQIVRLHDVRAVCKS